MKAFEPNYSRDGKWIYFTSEFQVWRMPSRGGNAVRLTAGEGKRPVEDFDGGLLLYGKPSSSESRFSARKLVVGPNDGFCLWAICESHPLLR
jgi:hypothetical protein